MFREVIPPLRQESISCHDKLSHLLPKLLQPTQEVQESPVRKESSLSEVLNHPIPEGFRNTSNLAKVGFTQQSPNVPSGMQSCEGEK